MQKPTEADINNFINQLVPFDLLLFQGNFAFSKLISNGSKIIRDNGQFSHVGLVMTQELLPQELLSQEFQSYNLNTRELLIIEVTVSKSENPVNLVTGKPSLGAQIRILKDVIDEMLENDCGVAACHLKENPYLKAKLNNDDILLQNIKDIVKQEYEEFFIRDQTTFDPNIFSLLGTIFPLLRPIRDTIDGIHSWIHKNHPWIFCAEFVCITYKHLGLIPQDTDEQEYLPVDFVIPDKENDNNVVNSIMHLPPIFLYKTHDPTREEANKFFFGIFR